jgi:co-chaperonin GroES (HSP10)
MKKITLFLSAMLFSVMSFAGLGEGYTKVTDITTLAAGDKVVVGKFVGTDITLDKVEYKFVKLDDILAVVTD